MIKKFLLVFFGLIFLGLAVLFLLPAKNATNHFPSVLLFAHKAINPCFPENTLEGIQFLQNNGAKAVEIDVRKTSDNKWILFHDATGKILLNDSGFIKTRTYDDLVKGFLRFRDTISACKIALLSDVLDSIGSSLFFYIDVKEPTISNAEELVAIIKSRKLENTVLLATPNSQFILYIKFKYPEIKVALEGFNAGKELIYNVLPRRLRPDFLASFYYKTDDNHFEWLRNNSLLESKIVYDVTVDSYQKMKDAGYMKLVVDYDSTLFMKK